MRLVISKWLWQLQQQIDIGNSVPVIVIIKTNGRDILLFDVLDGRFSQSWWHNRRMKNGTDQIKIANKNVKFTTKKIPQLKTNEYVYIQFDILFLQEWEWRLDSKQNQ